MSFAKPQAAQGAGLDDYKKLLCTEPGCGARWTVMVDRPKCSRHAWGGAVDTSKPLPFFDGLSTVAHSDGKGWARRIVWLREKGFEVRPISLRFAREALGAKGAV